MSGKSIGSWTAGLIIIAGGQDCCTLSSGKDLTTPLMQQVGNHPNTLRMHLTWSRHSTRLIQLSWPPKFMRRGPCSIYFLTLSHTEPFCLNIFLEFLFFLLIYRF